MSALDEIIARSRTPGTFVERRHFTLSREKAIEKLREFSLRHPRQYILELIQAAVFAGATYIAVDINRDRLLVAWVGGRSFQKEELGSIFDYLFADRGEMSTRHLTQLAIGLNALLQRKPKLIRIESGDGTSGSTTRMDIDKTGEGELGVPESGLAGTYLLVEYPRSWLPRLQRSGYHPEEGLIETRCLYVPVPVLLNGRAPFGYRASREIHLYGIRHQQSFDEDGRRGVIGLPGQEMGRAGRIGREFRMVVGGVWINSLELPELGGPPDSSGGHGALSGVICDDRLRKTADQSDIVQDRRFVEMLHSVQPIATSLIRENVRRTYGPPGLPRIPDAVGEEEEQPAEPLPETIDQLGSRPSVTLNALAALPEGEPVFWTRPEDCVEIAEAVDPLRFGQLVLILTPGQVRSLELELPKLGLARLNNTADADFVRRVMERRQMLRLHSLPFKPTDRPDVRGRLRLRFHAAGSPPRWGDPREGDMPLLISANEETLWSGSLPLPIHSVSAVLELEDAIEQPASLLPMIMDAVVPSLWHLLLSEQLEGEALPDPTAEPALLAGVLGLNTFAYFVEAPDSAIQLDVALPPDWKEHAADFRGRALCSSDAGPLTLDTLIGLQGTNRVVTVEAGDRSRLEGIEERLGFGHLVAPGDEQAPIIAARRVDGRWKMVLKEADRQAAGPTVWIRPSLDPAWSPARSLHAALGRDSAGLEDIDWSAGEVLLQEFLVTAEDEGRWARIAPATGHSRRRCQGMARIALLALSLAHSPRASALQTATGLRVTVEALMEAGTLSVAPLHGPRTLDDQTVLLSYDELRLLSARGYQPRLRFDDAPEVWRSLADADDPRWLIRQEVRAPGLRGWIGLRTPFDGSSGILVQSVGSLIAIPQEAQQAPCHGLLWLSGGHSALNSAQLELLTLARKQLYQRLSEGIERLDGPSREAGEQYLRAYATERAPRRLVHTDQRPLMALQARIKATLDSSVYIKVIEDPRPRRSGALRIETDELKNGVVVLLNPEHDITKQALRAPRSTSAELLLLEMARRIAVWSGYRERRLDLLEMQRVLIAQRVATTRATSPAAGRQPASLSEAD